MTLLADTETQTTFTPFIFWGDGGKFECFFIAAFISLISHTGFNYMLQYSKSHDLITVEKH